MARKRHSLEQVRNWLQRVGVKTLFITSYETTRERLAELGLEL